MMALLVAGFGVLVSDASLGVRQVWVVCLVDMFLWVWTGFAIGGVTV